MAIVTAATWQSFTNQTVTGAAATSVAAICTAVDAAVKRAIYPFYPEPTTITDCVLDAPMSNSLLLPVVPVRSLTSLYLRPGANGEVTAFTSDDLLTVNSDYWLQIDRPIEGYSRGGLVRRRGASIWGYEVRRPLGRLAPTLDPNRGAIKVTFAAGPSAVPSDIEAAAILAVSILYDRKERGVSLGSESWNGYSSSVAGPFGAEAAINTPDIAAMLLPYKSVHIGSG